MPIYRASIAAALFFGLLIASLPARAESLWLRLEQSYQLQDIQHPDIERWEAHWRTRGAELRMLLDERGHWLLPILDLVSQRGLPGELALLPFIESKLDTQARSKRDATGLWQIRPATADSLGLSKSEWHDDRLNPVRATAAALDYLQSLHSRFGSWPLTLAAYNAGQGRVSRALQKARTSGARIDYWHLSLPRESRDYVPKLIALSRVLADGTSLRLPWVDPSLAPVAVHAGGPVDLHSAAKVIGIPLDTLYNYNPQLKLWALPAKPHDELLIPAFAFPKAEQALRALPPEKRIHWETETVKRGDSLGLIASRWKTSVSLLRSVNALNDDRIFVGQRLRIPINRKSLPQATVQAAAREKRIRTQTVRNGEWHRVDSGETLWNIARRYGRSVALLRRWNSLGPKDPLFPGQSLRVAPPPGTNVVLHAVDQNDSLVAVAKRYGVTVPQLRRWNRLGNQDLSAERELLVFAPH